MLSHAVCQGIRRILASDDDEQGWSQRGVQKLYELRDKHPWVSAEHTSITPSQYEWERRGLDFVRAGLPNHDPYRAWANFEFQTPDGAIYEVDLLVLTKQGFWLVEIKSWPGHVRGDAGTWTRTNDGRTRSEDNPVMLANRKAKALVSLLKSQQAVKKVRVPWMDALVFLSADDLQCDLTGPARNRVLLKDKPATDNRSERKGILAALLNREGPGIDPDCRSMIDGKVAKAISRAIEQSGIRPSQRSRRVGDYVLEKLLVDGPGYQDRLAKHASFDDVHCRVRQYTVAQAASEEDPGVEVSERVSFDLQLGLPDATRHHLTFDGFVLRHPEFSQNILYPLTGENLHHGVFQRDMMRKPAAAR